MLKDNNLTLSEIFNNYIEQYSKEYGQELDDVIIAMSDKVLHISEKASEELDISEEEVIKRANKYCDELGLGVPAFFNYDGDFTDNRNIELLFFNITSDARLYPQGILDYTSNFDHELGHKVADSENHSIHLSESMADAHSALMHIKRFGKSSNHLQQQMLEISMGIIFASQNHYTPAVFAAVDKLKDKMNIEELSMRDISKLNKEIAKKYHFKNRILDKMAAAYETVYDRYVKNEEEKNSESYIKTLVEVMLENKKDHDVYRVGAYYLKTLDAKSEIAEQREINSDFLKEELAQLKLHEEEIGFIFDAAEAADAKRGYSALDRIVKHWNKKHIKRLSNKKAPAI